MAMRTRALELLADWSKWLVTVQIAVCTVLWNVLKQQQEQLAAWRLLLVLGWLAFALSILAASLLLAMVPHAVDSQLRPRGAPLEPPPRAQRLVSTLGIVQYALFAMGGVLLLAFVLLTRLV